MGIDLELEAFRADTRIQNKAFGTKDTGFRNWIQAACVTRDTSAFRVAIQLSELSLRMDTSFPNFRTGEISLQDGYYKLSGMGILAFGTAEDSLLGWIQAFRLFVLVKLLSELSNRRYKLPW